MSTIRPLRVTIHASGLVEIHLASYDHSTVRKIAKLAGFDTVEYENKDGALVKTEDLRR